MDFWKNHKSIIIVSSIIILILGIVAASVAYIVNNYKITTVYVDGNKHYTNEEIRNMVMDGFMGDNSMFLSLKYKDKSIENVPFVAKMDVEIVDPNTIRINVYEKAIAGYVEYLEKYMYFDKDGVVIEASTQRTKGIPQVTGLTFDHVVIKEPLPVENTDIFNAILNITQLVNKYNLSIDKIYFAKDDSITLHFERIKVALGQPNNLDEKIMKLQYILPEIKGKSGIIRLETYTDDTQNISFEPESD